MNRLLLTQVAALRTFSQVLILRALALGTSLRFVRAA